MQAMKNTIRDIVSDFWASYDAYFDDGDENILIQSTAYKLAVMVDEEEDRETVYHASMMLLDSETDETDLIESLTDLIVSVAQE